MCTGTGYKSLPYVLALIAIADLVLGILRIYVYFSPKSSTDPSSLSDVFRYSLKDEVSSPLPSSVQTRAAFGLDWISSTVPTLMGVYLILFGFVSCFAFCCSCDFVVKKIKAKDKKYKQCGPCCTVTCFMCMNKANHRFISLSCNCPCYRARPKLRFQVRLGLTIFFVLLRTIAVILYATDKNVRSYGDHMATLCGISLALLLIVMVIDIYQFRVWWYYRPEGLYEPCRFWCCAPQYYQAHRRFLPMPLLGKYRRQDQLGDRPCTKVVDGFCPDRSLEHITMFHSFNYKPLRRFDPAKDTTYIGFHSTTVAGAIGISKTNFRRSEKPPQMLGFGVYFARSFGDTEGKARHTGAYIVAEVRMGRVWMLPRDQVDKVRNSKEWWKDYDTVYCVHPEESRDEFCVKDPDQVLKWIMVMNDNRLYKYGLDKEFDSTMCGCI